MAGEAAVRGVLGAMGMTGLRRVTTGLGLLSKPPPDEIATEGVPGLLARIPPSKQGTAIELAHWSFGALASVGYNLLPRRLRGHQASGPLYGLAIWAVYEATFAPWFDAARTTDRTAGDRVALALDHALYGAIIQGAATSRRG